MATCEWSGCADPATHTVDISFPEGTHEMWQVCRMHDRALKFQVVRSRPKATSQPDSTPPKVEIQCGECLRFLDEPISLSDAERQPCPDCGSVTRRHKISVFETLTLHESLRLRSRQVGKGGWMTDIRSGDDYTRDLEAWGTRILEKDRTRNIYREVITLHDGTVVQSQARLTDHHD